LPASANEAGIIRKTFFNSTVLEGRRATLDALAVALPGADIVHFGGHGYTNSSNGAVILAAEDTQAADYDLLQSADLRRQDWSRCRLAVLSACATAAGETRGAPNPDSLVRALVKAGVPRIAASLWSVDSDATAELMKEFYSSLARGEDAARALRAAQQHVRRQKTAWDHPYYWSGFQLYGTI
jgi:CHAT domain-containing protein